MTMSSSTQEVSEPHPDVVDDIQDDEEDEMDYSNDQDVELGFVVPQEEEEEPLVLHENADWSQWGGGKVGGQPSWLTPHTLPSVSNFCCKECSTPLSFLLQIYCPLDDEPDAFHRSLYLFCCRNRACNSQGHARIYRNQLPKENPIYPSEVHDYELKASASTLPTKTRCALCSLPSEFTCSACKQVHYCCKEHQKDHWKHGHKQLCSSDVAEKIETVELDIRTNGSKWIFPEYELEIEQEPDATEAVDDQEAKLISDFQKAQMHPKTQDDASNPFTDDSQIDLTQKELNEMLGATGDQDKEYVRFLTRIALAKDQVLRYARWQDDALLWVHEKGMLETSKVPACERCGANRQFEFQVLPQLIYYLKEDQSSNLQEIGNQSCEWGTLAVFTCSKSCPIEGQYAEEFVHYQPAYSGK